MITPTETLAYRRTIWALERTQLAWIRTAFAMIGAGLALDRGTVALHEARLLQNAHWVESGHVAGVVLATLASLQLSVMTWLTVKRYRQLADAMGQPPESLMAIVPLSIFIALIGLVTAVLLASWN